MHEQDSTEIPVTASAISLAIALLLACLCLFAWWQTGKIYFLLGGIGFATVSPIWYRSPISFRALIGPIGGRIAYNHKFTAVEGLLSLVGYSTIAIAIAIWLFQLLQA